MLFSLVKPSAKFSLKMGFVFALIFATGLSITLSNPPPNCEWGLQWKGSSNSSREPCPSNSRLAFVKFYNETFEARCCADKASLKKEQKYAKQCNTTSCLVSWDDKVDPCSTLTTQYFIKGKPLKYEAGVDEDCKDPKTGRKGKAAVCCPKQSLDRLLLSAQAAEEDEFPHMGSTGGCGCTVYSSEWLISAAHCFVNSSTGEIYNFKKKPVNIILGTNLNNINSTLHAFPVERVVIHPGYSQLKGHPERQRNVSRSYNDIALVKLKKKIDFQKLEPFIRALPLAPHNFRPEDYSDQVIILGWGTTGFGTGSQHLQKANLLLRDKDVCFHKTRGKYSYASEFKSQFLCLGGIVNGSASGSAGGGDSGGPAICRDREGNAVLCGVSSFGADVDEDECGELQTEDVCFPSAYDDIGYFRKWIEDEAGYQEEDRGIYKVKLYGDEDIPKGKYLHQVHITTEDGKRCGGTLVSKDRVVTSAHCAVNDNGRVRKGIRIVAGVRDLNRKISERNVYRVRRRNGVVFFSNFTRDTLLDSLNQGRNGKVLFRDSPYAHDIAILKLDQPVESVSREMLPRLPDSFRFEPGPAVEIAFPWDTKRSGRLMQRKFDILTKKECKIRFKRFKLVGIDTRYDKNEVMCGVERYSGGSTCDRELGGALICKDNVFCGVQTFRTCHMTIPSAFLNVGRYLDWIMDEL